ncbi:glycosyltransferase [Halorarius litoreus]|uniref:glycosyltransferase n=1 Tax=Halorarius litoreus TaxID=2962676 RepID=UPI0020CC6EE2|nr:glycosyltransferase [Halorarius litoreus]
MSDTHTETRDGELPPGRDATRSVVVPVYCERPAVWTGLVERLRSNGWDEVVVCLDEPDEPARTAAARLDTHDWVTLSVSRTRRGKGGALQAGLSAATGAVVGYVDADGAVRVDALDEIYRQVETGAAAVAVGSRDTDDACRAGQSPLRRALGGGYRWLARRVTGVPVTDFQCGAKAFRRDVWAQVAPEMTEAGFAFDTELLARAYNEGFGVTEVPIEWNDPGDSDVRVGRDVPKLFGSLWRLNGSVDASDTDDTDDGPLRLALVSSHPPNRGHLAEYGEELATAYGARDDVSVTVLARQTEGAPRVEQRSNYTVKRVWKRDSLPAAKRILGELRREPYDAVHFNLHMTYFGTTNAYRFLGLALPPLCRATLDAPVVTTLHDLLEIVEDDQVDADVGRLERLGARLATQLVLLSDATTVTADEYRDILDQRYPLGDPVHVPHGTFKRADGGVPAIETPLRLLVFGFLGPTKDIETTVGAFERIREQVPDAELVIAGGTHPDYPDHRAELEARFGDIPGVEFTGYVDEDDLDGVWNDASLVVMPYHTCTGVSGVFQLAKSYGKPVVAFENEGMRTSTVETGGAAAFVEPGSEEALAARVVDLWHADGELEALASENAAAGTEVTMAETTDRIVELFGDTAATATADDGGDAP